MKRLTFKEIIAIVSIVVMTLFCLVAPAMGQEITLTPEQITEMKADLSAEFNRMDKIIKQAEDKKIELRGQWLMLDKLLKPKIEDEDKE